MPYDKASVLVALFESVYERVDLVKYVSTAAALDIGLPKLTQRQQKEAVHKIKEKHKTQQTKQGHSGKEIVKRLRTHMETCWQHYKLYKFQRAVARANGWVDGDEL